MVRDMLIRHRHLAPTDAGSDVRHAVVIPNLLVLIVGIVLAVLSRVHHYFVPGVLIGCDERAVTVGRNHLVPLKERTLVEFPIEYKSLIPCPKPI